MQPSLSLSKEYSTYSTPRQSTVYARSCGATVVTPPVRGSCVARVRLAAGKGSRSTTAMVSIGQSQLVDGILQRFEDALGHAMHPPPPPPPLLRWHGVA